jgi:hypothetical protein
MSNDLGWCWMSQSTKKKGQVIDRLITDLICNDRQHRRCGLMMLCVVMQHAVFSKF